jgi:hypothetical protein
MQRICVFCGSQVGHRDVYRQVTEELAEQLVQRGYGLVYGGGRVGLMGVLADAVLVAGGEVIGVIPEAMVARELAHSGVNNMHVVTSMHARKARMVDLADAFIALPGGYGTLEELFEIITWAQLGIHQKPIGLLNVGGYFDVLTTFVEQAIVEGFVREEHRQLTVVADAPAALLDALAQHTLPQVSPWLSSKDA